jgi:hypothetical protein
MPDGKGKEEIYKVAERESEERAWAANSKLVFDDRSAHSARLHNIAEDNLQESVNFTKQIHQQYIKREQDSLENNRYTLNYLYGLYPEEYIALRDMIKQYIADNKQG